MKFVSSRFTWVFCVSLLAGLSVVADDVIVDVPVLAVKEKAAKRREEFLRNIPMPVRVPGEFGKLSAVILSADDLVHIHPELFASLVEAISSKVPVIAVVTSYEQLLSGREALEEAGLDRSLVHFLVHPLDTMWIRDYGPIFMRRSDGSGCIIDTFYDATDRSKGRFEDDQFPWILANMLNLSSAYVPLSMEGGNFLSNGQGISVCSNKMIERNLFRKFGNEEFKRLMASYFNLRSLVVVAPLPGEPTGHADMFMTFLTPRQVVVAKALPGERAAVAKVLDDAAEQMAAETLDSAPLVVSRIPLAPRLGEYWRSYTNVFFVNGLMLVPSYSDVDPAIEKEVVETYQRLLPKWEIRQIQADGLVEVGGFLHCMTIGVPHFIDPSNLLELTD